MADALPHLARAFRSDIWPEVASAESRALCARSSRRGRIYRALSLAAGLLFWCSSPLQAAATQTQTVNYTVPAVSVLSISGDVTFPNFTAPSSGQNFTSVISTGSTYSVSNNGGVNSKKIVAHLISSMPVGLTLLATLTAPAGANTISNVTMTTSDQDLVTGIDNGAFSANQIKYTLSADVTQAQVASGQTLSLTYTLLSS